MREITQASERAKRAEYASWVAITLTVIAIVLLVALHILSPEFSPSWRVISEYALGQYGWVLSLMFISFGMGPWALAVAIWPQIKTRAGKVGLWILLLSGLGGTMAAFFDVNHPIGHGIAGLLGVIGLPSAALLLSASLGHNANLTTNAKRGLVWLAHLTWISVVLLVVTLVVMTIQVSHAYGGHLPQHAPKSLPPGVFALDGWADRLVVLSNCAWVLFAAGQVIHLRRKYLISQS